MDTVHADLNALLQTLKNMQTAIHSIESTKVSMSKKYRQLGNGWNDKKYRDLGDVIQDCSKALNEVLEVFSNGEKFVGSLVRSLQEYEDTTFGHSPNQSQGASESGENLRTEGDFYGDVFDRSRNIDEALKGVEYKPIQPSSLTRSEQQIIGNISGGDMTEGSCSSLALAYAGNRAGYVVYDFRDGQSREVFSRRETIEQIANLDGVNSIILHGTDDIACAQRLLLSMEPGRQYYMATGAHAAVVRLNNEGIYQYLELQSGTPSENGWHYLNPRVLYLRFGCEVDQSRGYSNYLIELDSLQNNAEFLDLLGYINTDETAQMRGASGHVR